VSKTAGTGRKTEKLKMKKNNSLGEVMIIIFGELIVSALVVLGFLVASAFGYPFTYKVITGVLLGSAVTVGNFYFLTVSVNRAVDRYLELRGSREMDEEEAAKFTEQHSMAIQNTITKSFIIRTVTMLAAFVLAFITGVFEPIATVIPLLMYRPIISVGNLIRSRLAPPEDSTAQTGEDRVFCQNNDNNENEKEEQDR